MSINGEEGKVKHILTDSKLSAIKAMLEKDHAIDCLLLLHLKKGKWKDAKGFMVENNLTMSDGIKQIFQDRFIMGDDHDLLGGRFTNHFA